MDLELQYVIDIYSLLFRVHRTEDVRPALLQTLADLQLTYLDLYLMHWPIGFRPGLETMPRLPDGSIAYDTETHFLETWRAMEGLVKEGLVRHIGLSNFNSKQITEVPSLQCYMTRDVLTGIDLL